MKLSAKLTTVSFLAASALGLGAFAFGGCTVTSGTVDDTDSGTPTGDSGTTTDSGKTDGGTAATCEGNKQGADLVSPTCQACLNAKCCTELKGCFNLTVDTDGGTLDCNGFSQCVSDCYDKPQADQAACLDECGTAAGTGVEDGYNGIVTCTDSNCNTECNPQDPDAGDGG